MRMKSPVIVALALFVSTILVSCDINLEDPFDLHHGPAYYAGKILFDPDGNLHIVYSNDHQDNPVHLEYRNGNLQSKFRPDLPLGVYSVYTAYYLNGKLCIISGRNGAYDDDRYLGCEDEAGRWRKDDLNYVKDENGVFYEYDEHGGGIVTGYGVLVMAHSKGAEIEFKLVDEIKGTASDYPLPPIEAASVIEMNKPDFEYTEAPQYWVVPFIEDGEWDGKSFIWEVVFTSKDAAKKTSYLYWATCSDAGWQVNNIDSHGFPWEEYSGRNLLLDEGLSLEYYHAREAMLMAWMALLRKEGVGVIPVPINAGYKASYAHARWQTIDGHEAEFLSAGVDLDGKLHTLVTIRTGDRRGDQQRLYHQVYNPDSPTPEVPEITELIEFEVNR